MKELLIEKMKVFLSTTFSFYLKTHYFHWNVEGINFVQFHEFFDDLYNEVWNSIDLIAEHIRTLDAYAPGSYSRFSELSIIKCELNIPDSRRMIGILLSDNESLLQIMSECLELSNTANEQGLSNFIQDRIDIHKKHRWMMKSIIKEISL